MIETRPPRRLRRRIGAVLAGLLAIVVLDVGIDAILHASGVFSPWGEPMDDRLYLLAVAYRVVDGIIGGYVVARLAPDRPVQHALALGVVGVILSTMGAAATWNAGPAFGPRWYPLVLVAVALPCAWLGGTLARGTRAGIGTAYPLVAEDA